jgi:hypothetical protein
MVGTVRTIGTIGAFRTLRALNAFDAFNALYPVGKLRAFYARTGCLFLLARRLIPAPCGLTLAVCSVTVEGVSQSLIVRVLRDVPDQALVGTLHRLVCWIRIRERCRRAQDHRHAGCTNKFFHEFLSTPVLSYSRPILALVSTG